MRQRRLPTLLPRLSLPVLTFLVSAARLPRRAHIRTDVPPGERPLSRPSRTRPPRRRSRRTGFRRPNRVLRAAGQVARTWEAVDRLDQWGYYGPATADRRPTTDNRQPTTDDRRPQTRIFTWLQPESSLGSNPPRNPADPLSGMRLTRTRQVGRPRSPDSTSIAPDATDLLDGPVSWMFRPITEVAAIFPTIRTAARETS